MTFGTGTPVDWLSWLIVATLSAKLIATAILLARPAATRLATRDGRALWWTTKLTPPVAAVSLATIGWLDHDREALIGGSLLLLFVAISVPVAIKRRHRGSLGHQMLATLRRFEPSA